MKKIFPLVLISIGVAMISVLSQFTIPFGPIPLTPTDTHDRDHRDHL